MSVAIGSSAAGARTYTATASQGLLFMAEAVYNASGPRPADRDDGGATAPSARRSTSGTTTPTRMSQRDCGWLQLFAETNQEALDLHIQAFRLAEELSLPVMVCMDGFILTHAYERIDMPDQAAGRRLPAALRATRRCWTPASPVLDRRHGRAGSLHGSALPRPCQADGMALELIPQIAAEFQAAFGRESRRPRARLPHAKTPTPSSWRWAR